MLPGLELVDTNWLSKTVNIENPSKLLLAVNDFTNDIDNNISLSSITEIFSEYFNQKIIKKHLSGIDALSSFDENNDFYINSDDEIWKDIILWFDDGDGISINSEIKPISDFVESINLNTYQIIKTQPSWSNGNRIIGNLEAYPIDTYLNHINCMM